MITILAILALPQPGDATPARGEVMIGDGCDSTCSSALLFGAICYLLFA